MDFKPCFLCVYTCVRPSNYMVYGSLYFEVLANIIVVQQQDYFLIFLAIGLKTIKEDEIEMNNSSLKDHILC
jgi:hypothetical protein